MTTKLPQLPRQPVPDWLRSISAEQRLPIPELLRGSLYYPACGIDGRPVEYIGGYCHSFVYVDYGIPLDQLESLLKARGAFSKYQLTSSRLLEPNELPIRQAWTEINLDVRLDGNPRHYRHMRVTPYAFWAIFDHERGVPDSHGPERFSLLYLAEDGVAAYHALYHSNGEAPEVLAIIQPGEGFGWNWTHFFDSRQVFCRTVMSNPFGKPRYLFLGGQWQDLNFQQQVVWPGYGRLIKLREHPRRGLKDFWPGPEGYLGLWQAEEQIV